MLYFNTDVGLSYSTGPTESAKLISGTSPPDYLQTWYLNEPAGPIVEPTPNFIGDSAYMLASAFIDTGHTHSLTTTDTPGDNRSVMSFHAKAVSDEARAKDADDYTASITITATW